MENVHKVFQGFSADLHLALFRCLVHENVPGIHHSYSTPQLRIIRRSCSTFFLLSTTISPLVAQEANKHSIPFKVLGILWFLQSTCLGRKVNTVNARLFIIPLKCLVLSIFKIECVCFACDHISFCRIWFMLPLQISFTL